MTTNPIKLITKYSVLPTIDPLNWDLVIVDIPYYVAHVDGFVHSIHYKNGREWANDLLAWPRDEQPLRVGLEDQWVCWFRD